MKFVATSLSFFLGLGMVVGSPLGDSDGHALARRSYNTGYANQLTDGTACRAVTVLWARGTGQQGNIGVSTDVGPMFLDDLAAKVGTNNLAAQGVNYSASVSGFEQGGDPAGSTLLANLATQVCFGDRKGGTRTRLNRLSRRHTHSAPTRSWSCPDTVREASSFTTRRNRSPLRSPTSLLLVRANKPRLLQVHVTCVVPLEL